MPLVRDELRRTPAFILAGNGELVCERDHSQDPLDEVSAATLGEALVGYRSLRNVLIEPQASPDEVGNSLLEDGFRYDDGERWSGVVLNLAVERGGTAIQMTHDLSFALFSDDVLVIPGLRGC
jgi:hypothetical protein